jgi:hypothetical protein
LISRGTARLIAGLCASAFTKHYSSGSGLGHGYLYSDAAAVYDFLYDNDFPAWLCNGARAACSTSNTRTVQDYLMKLHTGETQYPVTKEWTWQQREQLGQKYLQQLAEAILRERSSRDGGLDSAEATKLRECRAKLELDGFTFRDGRLLAPEEDALDASEAAGVLEQLYGDLKLADPDTALHHLQLSEEHYLAGRWDDSIGNSRKFLECVLGAVAESRSVATSGASLPDSVASRPVRVREYLAQSGLLESKEKVALDSIYGLLSETGSHPYMAANEQARLLRHMALTFGQFVMLRLRGSLP